MFGNKKYQGECEGHYTGEGVIDGVRFNKRGGVVYRRAKEHISYNRSAVGKMKGKRCRVLYDVNNPGDSKAK